MCHHLGGQSIGTLEGDLAGMASCSLQAPPPSSQLYVAKDEGCVCVGGIQMSLGIFLGAGSIKYNLFRAQVLEPLKFHNPDERVGDHGPEVYFGQFPVPLSRLE